MDITRLIMSNPSVKRIKKAFEIGKASHAYIIEGERELVIHTLTVLSAIALCPQHGCMFCRACTTALKGLNVDCFCYPDKADHDRIKVDDIGALVTESAIAAKTGDNKVFLIDAALPSFAPNWQHKLLKTLEEPCDNVYLFIGVTNAGELLPTVRSRCYCVTLDKMPLPQITQYFVENGFNEADSQLSAVLSEGNTYHAEQILLDKDYGKMCNEVFACFLNMSNSSVALPHAAKLGAYENKRRQLFTLMQTILLESVKLTRSQPLNMSAYAASLKAVAEKYTPDAVVRIIDEIDAASRAADAGASFTAVLDNLLLKMLEIKQKCRP